MIHRHFEVGPFQCNCHILVDPESKRAIVIDPGDEMKTIYDELEKIEKKLGINLHLDALIHTHGHLDHIGATSELSATWKKNRGEEVRIGIHSADLELYNNLPIQGEMFGMKYEAPVTPQWLFEHQEEFKLGAHSSSSQFRVIHIPGHSPGSCAFELKSKGVDGAVQTTLFSGDTLFYRSVGRTDLWGANSKQMEDSIRKRIYHAYEDAIVYPGHGPRTTVASERENNPFVRS